MSATTAFISAVLNAYPTDTPDPFYAQWLDTLDDELRFNISQRRIDSFALAFSDTKVFTPLNIVAANNQLLIMKVVGAVRVDTVGTDPSSVSISGFTGVYGTDIYPGILLLSTRLVTSFTVQGRGADTATIELFLGHSEADA